MQRQAREELAGAMKLLVDGHVDQGLMAYKRCLREPLSVPAGLHVQMLQQSGRQELAAEVRRLGLLNGADLSVRRFLPGISPEALSAEYESLFDRGDINAGMLANYAVVLHKLGRQQELASLLDCSRYLHVGQLDVDAPSGGNEGLPSLLARDILSLEASATYQEAVQSVRDMWNLKSLHKRPELLFQTLVTAVSGEVARVIESWRGHDGPFVRWWPKDFKLEMWALTSRGTGYNTRHVHPRGWYTGVYYLTGLEAESGEGGTLRVGRPTGISADALGWPDITIRPRPGLLVLMPSYFVHWTEPLGRPGLRMSIAFDVVDAEAVEAKA